MFRGAGRCSGEGKGFRGAERGSVVRVRGQRGRRGSLVLRDPSPQLAKGAAGLPEQLPLPLELVVDGRDQLRGRLGSGRWREFVAEHAFRPFCPFRRVWARLAPNW
jgi:hypothetical protein